MHPCRLASLFRNIFTCAQAAAAVGPLEWCGMTAGKNQAAWAFVCTEAKRVGDIWMKDQDAQHRDADLT